VFGLPIHRPKKFQLLRPPPPTAAFCSHWSWLLPPGEHWMRETKDWLDEQRLGLELNSNLLFFHNKAFFKLTEKRIPVIGYDRMFQFAESLRENAGFKTFVNLFYLLS
jgi:hypothetical protein